jgi:hypothetical protein
MVGLRGLGLRETMTDPPTRMVGADADERH